MRRASMTPSIDSSLAMMRSIDSTVLTWNKKRMSAMPSRCEAVEDESTSAPHSESAATTSTSRFKRSSASMKSSTL